MIKTLLKNATIINNDCSLTEKKDIYIENGKIKQIVNVDFGEKVGNEYEIIDCSDYYITPSFVNLHCHSAMSIFKGIAEDVTINDWFNKEIFPYESKLSNEDIYYGVRLAVLEMLDNGVTAFADHYFGWNTVLRAVLDSKIRADIAPTIFGLAPDYKEQLENAISFITENKNISNRVNLRLGPHAPYTCPNPILQEIVEAAKKLKVGIHLHVAETEEQVKESKEKTNCSPFEVIYKSGGFDYDMDVLVAHGLWIQEDDMKFLNNNTWFAFCPKTYMKLAMGQGNIYKFKDKLNFSFGTDGASSSNTLSPLEQARLFALNGKLLQNNSEDFTIKEIWQNLMNGHKALKFNTGVIQEGYDADLIIWNLKKPNTYPVYNPVTSILYSANSSNILYTMVEGDFLKFNGKLVLEEAKILNKICDMQHLIIERGKGEKTVNY